MDELAPPIGTSNVEGWSEVVQPEGACDDIETVPLKPLSEVTVMFEMVVEPFVMVMEAGEAEMEKSLPIPGVKFQVIGLPRPVTRS